MYIDESGVENITQDKTKRSFDYDWFTTGGIIVRDDNIAKFEHVHDHIIKNNFTDNGIELSANFKLHYNEPRQKKYPYSQISDQMRRSIADEIFKAITAIDCKLVSVTICKSDHISRYDYPMNVRAYTLWLCLERFEYFLQGTKDDGVVVYERFSTRLRKKMNAEIIETCKRSRLLIFTNSVRIWGRIINGDPVKEKVLQFPDFFVYAPYIKTVRGHKKGNRWQEIRNKCYGRNVKWYSRGFVVIR